MSDMGDELRELFREAAEKVPRHREVPPALARRARRRIARNALGAGLVVVALVAGGLAGARALGGPGAGRPAGEPTLSPTAQPSASPGQPSATRGCAPAQLRAVAFMQGAAGSREGEITVTNLSEETCTLKGTPIITLVDQNLQPITEGVQYDTTQASWQVNALPPPPGWPVVTLKAGDAASVRVRWSNWCPSGRAAPLWTVGVPIGGTVDVNGMDSVSPPPCNGPGLPSIIEGGPFEPATP